MECSKTLMKLQGASLTQSGIQSVGRQNRFYSSFVVSFGSSHDINNSDALVLSLTVSPYQIFQFNYFTRNLFVMVDCSRSSSAEEAYCIPASI